MHRFAGIVFTILSATSLALLPFIAVLWVRSRSGTDRLSFYRAGRHQWLHMLSHQNGWIEVLREWPQDLRLCSNTHFRNWMDCAASIGMGWSCVEAKAPHTATARMWRIARVPNMRLRPPRQPGPLPRMRHAREVAAGGNSAC